jgi:hypothetical protein
VTPQVVDNLLKTLSEECRATWHETGEYKLVWHEMYADMVKYYVDRVKFYGDKYMTSPAGMSLKTAIAKHRKRHISVPVVDENTLFNYAGAEGIAWTIKEVADFYFLLAEITNVEYFETSVCSSRLPSFNLID